MARHGMQVGVQNPARSTRTSSGTRGLAWVYLSARLKLATNGIRRKVSSELPVACNLFPQWTSDFDLRPSCDYPC
ncbi:hypothetical protein N431DRAFT_436460 [Stipitochalara longipes BDJ]|nr:hypothetical protein N431DRAFT_436460 [Stipitochalara longipes BDJ]